MYLEYKQAFGINEEEILVTWEGLAWAEKAEWRIMAMIFRKTKLHNLFRMAHSRLQKARNHVEEEKYFRHLMSYRQELRFWVNDKFKNFRI